MTEEELHAISLAKVLEYLEGMGPEDGHLLTNDRVLEVMDLHETATTSKLLALVIAMAGIHPDWQDKHLKDRFRSYLVQSATTLRQVLEAEPLHPNLGPPREAVRDPGQHHPAGDPGEHQQDRLDLPQDPPPHEGGAVAYDGRGDFL